MFTLWLNHHRDELCSPRVAVLDGPTQIEEFAALMSQVVTRFAPSPTGFLHIGGARTALFNWLYAKKHGGRMMLRIEDTDRERSTQAAIDAIIDGLQWLGLEWDGDIVYQSARAARHAEVAEELLAQGTPIAATPPRRSSRRCARRPRRKSAPGATTAAGAIAIPPRRPPARPMSCASRRPRTARRSSTTRCRARSSSRTRIFDDFILLRSDGAPTYMLAVVVDDHDMGVTQIIRGDDHLTNAARQTHIYQAMGWDVPAFAHIPLIHGPDGAKLSKRHGALGVDAYRAMGYLPAALRNYLVRLGWSQGDKEFFTTQEMVDAFDLAQVPFAGALRFRQARKYERPLSARPMMTSCSTCSSRRFPISKAATRSRRRSTTERARSCAPPCRA